MRRQLEDGLIIGRSAPPLRTRNALLRLEGLGRSAPPLRTRNALLRLEGLGRFAPPLMTRNALLRLEGLGRFAPPLMGFASMIIAYCVGFASMIMPSASPLVGFASMIIAYCVMSRAAARVCYVRVGVGSAVSSRLLLSG